jgi:hypothetical protein
VWNVIRITFDVSNFTLSPENEMKNKTYVTVEIQHPINFSNVAPQKVKN